MEDNPITVLFGALLTAAHEACDNAEEAADDQGNSHVPGRDMQALGHLVGQLEDRLPGDDLQDLMTRTRLAISDQPMHIPACPPSRPWFDATDLFMLVMGIFFLVGVVAAFTQGANSQ